MKRLFSLILGATLLMLSGNLFAQNLINNGGFEMGTPGDVGSGNLTGWINTGAADNFLDDCSQMAAFHTTTCPHSGTYQAVFGSVDYHSSLSQSVNTTAGANYVISFWLANDDGHNAATGDFTSIDVTFGGISLLSATDQPRFGWTQYQFLVTATGSSSLLKFDIEQDPSYYYLDDVSVVQTPEPASLALLFSGLSLGAGALRKFRS